VDIKNNQNIIKNPGDEIRRYTNTQGICVMLLVYILCIMYESSTVVWAVNTTQLICFCEVMVFLIKVKLYKSKNLNVEQLMPSNKAKVFKKPMLVLKA
jgi:hypothetical protein